MVLRTGDWIERGPAAVFAERVRETPERLAVAGMAQRLTYAELDRAADHVARAVDAAGIADGAAVAIDCRDPVNAVAAIVGVLKTAHPWVSVDAALTRSGTAAQLADAGAGLRVADDREAAWSGRSLEFCATAAAAAGGPEYRPRGAPDAPACIVYTSGTTGRPKGVLRGRETLAHTAQVYAERFAVTADDRFALLASLAHGAGVSDTFRALFAGASLHPFDLRRGGFAGLAAWLRREEATVLHAVPSLFRQFVAALRDNERLHAIRLVHLGGEKPTRADVVSFRGRFATDAVLVNNLGATEAPTILQRVFTAADADAAEAVVVGGPVPGVAVSLVDESGAEVAPGAVGRIAVRSRYLALGYWRRPEATRAAFRSDAAGGRVHVTRDLGRRVEGGGIEYVGRSDRRHKVRGSAVDPAAADRAFCALLGDDPAVADAAVVAHEAAGETRLVAYVAGRAGRPVDTARLRDRCRAQLPGHLVPAGFVVLPRLPRHADGTLEPTALPNPGTRARRPARRIHGPRTARERRLAELFRDVLGCGRVGRGDSFFDLGGDSLRALRLVHEIDTAFGVRVPAEALFDADTVARLAVRLAAEDGAAEHDSIEAMHAAERRPPLFAVGGLDGGVLKIRAVGRALGRRQPFFGLHPPAMDWSTVGCARLEEMAAHYVRIVRRVQARGPFHLLGSSFGGLVAFAMAVELQSAGESVALLAMIDTSSPRGSGRARRAAPRLQDPVMAAHTAASRGFSPRERFRGRILYFQCTGEPAAPRGAEHAAAWRDLATRGIRVVPLPGRHGRFDVEPQLGVVSRELSRALGRSRWRHGRPAFTWPREAGGRA